MTKHPRKKKHTTPPNMLSQTPILMEALAVMVGTSPFDVAENIYGSTAAEFIEDYAP